VAVVVVEERLEVLESVEMEAQVLLFSNIHDHLL